jgi:hypothetical protein
LIVTDKNIMMQDLLISNLDFLAKRVNSHWDNLIICDGDPGVGKSRFMKQVAYYLAWKLNRPFTHENVFMDAEKMAKFMTKTRKQIIVWDESAFEGMGQDWQSNIQKKLVKLLFTARKYGHTMIFIIPEIRKLQSVFAGKRSIALFRVFSPDNLTRGFFKLYDKSGKNQVYYHEKREMSIKNIPYYSGRFSNGDDIIDEVAYEKMKDEAINTVFAEKEEDNVKIPKHILRRERFAINIAKALINNNILKKVEVARLGGEKIGMVRQLVEDTAAVPS